MGGVPRMSSLARDTLGAIRRIALDASSASSLAERLLAALEPLVRFDDAEVLAVDADSLLFTRLLAYRGDRLPHFAFFLRDVYLVAREPDWLSLPRLLREGGGAAVFHERFEGWLRARPPAMSQAAFTRYWRQLQSPPGGGLRYGLAHRGRWVAILQLARWQPGPGFTASHLETLDRLAPVLGAAFARRLVGSADLVAQRETPEAGHMLFNDQRRLLTVDRSAEAWLRRLPDDGLRPFGVDVPVAIQSVVNCLWASADPMVVSHVADSRGVNVTIRAERARFVERKPGHVPTDAAPLFSVSLAATPWGAGHPAYRLLTARLREVALAVADGLGDEAIAVRLGISPATVHEHVQALHGVVGTKTRPALVATLNRGPRGPAGSLDSPQAPPAPTP